jgi:hypothetical protein
MNSRDFNKCISDFIDSQNSEWIVFGERLHEENDLTFDDMKTLICHIHLHQPHTLGLANLDLNDKQLSYLLKNLYANTSIKILYLPFNVISNQGAEAIAQFLKKNASITELFLFENRIDDIGMLAIANALIANETLLKLEVFCNPITKKMVQVFEKVMQLNHELEELVLFPPRLEQPFSAKINARLASNHKHHRDQHQAIVDSAGRHSAHTETLKRLSLFSKHQSSLKLLLAPSSSSEDEKLERKSWESSPYIP